MVEVEPEAGRVRGGDKRRHDDDGHGHGQEEARAAVAVASVSHDVVAWSTEIEHGEACSAGVARKVGPRWWSRLVGLGRT